MSDVEVEAAERIVRLIPSAETVVFTPSGSEAVMAALRLARAVTGRDLVVKFDGNYHGWHDYSLYNVSTPAREGRRPETRGIPSSVQETVVVLPYNDPDTFREYMEGGGCDRVAAVIMEPVAHSMGVVPATREFVSTVERLARGCGALLVFDEVVTGIRHNLHGMQYELGVRPDLTILGKAVANGMPVGVLAGRRDVMEELTRGVTVSGTYQAHPLSMAAVVASLDKSVRMGVDRLVARKGEEAAKLLRDLAGDARVRVYVAGFRSTIALYFGLDEWPRRLEEALRAHAEAYRLFASVLRREGVLVTPNPRKRMHLSAAHGEEELEALHRAAEKAFREVAERYPGLKW